MANVDSILTRVADNLKEARLNQNLSQQQVAEKAGISRRTLVDAETGNNISLATLIKILLALDAVERLDSLTRQSPISPVDLSRLKGKQRQRASGQRAVHSDRESSEGESSDDEWTW